MTHHGLDYTEHSVAWWYALDRTRRVPASVQLGAPGYVEGTRAPAIYGILAMPGLNRIAAATLTPRSSRDAARGFEQLFDHPAGTLSPPAQDYMFAAQQLPTSQLSWRSGNQADLRAAGLAGWHPDVAISVDDLARLDPPALLVWPTNDPVGDTATGRAIAAHLPDAELYVAGPTPRSSPTPTACETRQRARRRGVAECTIPATL